MTKEQLRQIITNSDSGKLHPELLKWIHSGKMDAELGEMIENDLRHSLNTPAISDQELNDLAKFILETRQNPEPPALPFSGNQHSRGTISFVWRAAAVLALVAAMAFVLVFYTRSPKEPVSTVHMVNKENSKGRKSTIFLNDGTVISLNSESRISYPEVFSDTLRRVALEGEAYFDVAHNPQLPFVISTGDISLTVLGTSFNVSAFNDQESIKISMNSGKVAIANTDQAGKDEGTIHLLAGESITYHKKTRVFSAISKNDGVLDFGWKDGKLAFKNAGMEDIFNRCERWYDVKFNLLNKPDFQWNYTGEFHNQTLQAVLESLSFSQKFTFTIDKNMVNISFNSF